MPVAEKKTSIIKEKSALWNIISSADHSTAAAFGLSDYIEQRHSRLLSKSQISRRYIPYILDVNKFRSECNITDTAKN